MHQMAWGAVCVCVCAGVTKIRTPPARCNRLHPAKCLGRVG
jgi:hypothetical protein